MILSVFSTDTLFELRIKTKFYTFFIILRYCQRVYAIMNCVLFILFSLSVSTAPRHIIDHKSFIYLPISYIQA